MKKNIFLLLFFFCIQCVFSQTNKEKALKIAEEAIKIMDQGKINESVEMLKESQNLDPENFIYPYEIAYSFFLREEYEEAIKILNKVKKYKSINSLVYQMSGNCYSYMGNPEMAIKEYEEGMKYFPNSGILYLEKGNVFLHQENYNEAIKNYEKGIAVEPEFPSNYFRLAKLFLNSTDKLSGIIYGELFMNLERSSKRSLEMSKLLYDTYKSSITFNENEIKVDFCEIYIDAASIKEDGEIDLPLCAIFGKNFMLAITEENTINLNSIHSLRTNFIKNYFKDDYKKYPNVLFEYHKIMLDNDLFEAYNHYLFQMGNQKEFNQWLENNRNKYDEFVKWYVKEENGITITEANRYIR